ncbi:MAG: 50S ribosomal protein L24 [Fusobacteria bacterium]|nr:50S ribosomal protein L24 [Fusobacteriota bacterium]
MKYNKIKSVPNRLHVKSGDMVQVISGKDKSKTGKVLRVFTAKGKVVVEGVNIVTKHLKPTQMNPQGGVVKKPNAMYSSKVMLFCEKCGKATRVAHKTLEDGQKVRVCKHCSEVL